MTYAREREFELRGREIKFGALLDTIYPLGSERVHLATGVSTHTSSQR